MPLFNVGSPDVVDNQTLTSDVDLLSADDKEFDKAIGKGESKPEPEVKEEKPSEVKEEKEVEKEEEKETPEEEKEPEKKEEKEEEPSEEDLDEEPEKAIGLQSKLEAKYPGISKEFPNLRNIIYSEKAFREIYPTVKEARETQELAGQMQAFETSCSAGNSELLLHSIKTGVSQEALERFAHNFLPTLQRIDKPTHYKVVNNIVKELLRHVDKLADEKIAQKAEHGEDLKHSVAHVTNALYNSTKIPDLEAPPASRVGEEDKLTNSISNDFINSTAQRGREQTIDLIEDAIKDLKLTPFQKRNLGREIFEEVYSALESDQRYRSLQKSLWDRALSGIKSGRMPDERTRLLHTLRERVKDILPAIRAKKLAEILPNDKQVKGTVPIPATKGTKIGGKEKLTTEIIRKNKMSDMDIILHGAGE